MFRFLLDTFSILSRGTAHLFYSLFVFLWQLFISSWSSVWGISGKGCISRAALWPLSGYEYCTPESSWLAHEDCVADTVHGAGDPCRPYVYVGFKEAWKRFIASTKFPRALNVVLCCLPAPAGCCCCSSFALGTSLCRCFFWIGSKSDVLPVFWWRGLPYGTLVSCSTFIPYLQWSHPFVISVKKTKIQMRVFEYTWSKWISQYKRAFYARSHILSDISFSFTNRIPHRYL